MLQDDGIKLLTFSIELVLFLGGSQGLQAIVTLKPFVPDVVHVQHTDLVHLTQTVDALHHSGQKNNK